jgi:MFS family permease
MSAEHATSRRGLWASFTNAGAPCGMVLSTLALSGTAALVGEKAFLEWGWRVPFLLSLVLLGIGLFVRMKVEETPVFKAERKPGSMPLLDVLRNHPRTLLLGIGVGLSAFVAQSTLTTFILAYGVQAGNSRQTILNALTLSSALAVIGILGWSAASDRFGRRPVVLAGAVLMAAFGFVLFPLVDNGFVVLALVLGQAVIHPMMYGPLAALYSELFNTGSRYTGASLGYQLASITAGGPAPIVALYLYQRYHTSMAVATYVALTALVSLVCVWLLRDREDSLDHK